MSTPLRLRTPRLHHDAMISHLRKELPNEGCGLLAGTADGMVCAHYALVNAAASPKEFLSEPKSMFLAMKSMRESKLDVVAIYHSHPTSPPIPSKTDLARNYSDDVVNIIVSFDAEPPLVSAWLLTAESFREAEWKMVEEQVRQ